MKKLIALLMAALLSVSLCSCGGNSSEPVENTDSAVEDVSNNNVSGEKTASESSDSE